MGLFKWYLAAASLLVTAVQSSGQFSVELPYKQVSVEVVNETAKFSGALITGEVGKPAMPHYVVSFMLPPDVNLNDVKVSFNNVVDQEISGEFSVKPVDPPYDEYGIPKWPAGIALVNGMDTSIYGKNVNYPTDYKGNVETGKMRQYKLVDITINPYKWNPVTKKLRKITGGTLLVSVPKSVLSTSDSIRGIQRCSWAEEILAKKVVNFSEAQLYGATPEQSSSLQSKSATMSASAMASGTGYAIVTTDYLYYYSQGIKNYINDLNSKGFTTYVITEDKTGDGNTRDACTNNIRTYLKNNYLSLGLRYVLLIGNPDTSNTDLPDVPMFGNTNLTDFNYSEYTDDNIPEVLVGRIPVYTMDGTRIPDIQALDKILNKTIAYKNSTNQAWRQSALVPVVPLYANNDDFQEYENVVNNTLKPAGMICRRLYDPYNTFSFNFVANIVNKDPLPEVPFCTKDWVLANWINFNPGVVMWHTHGADWQAVDIMDNSKASSLNDNYPSIVYSGSCSNSTPGNPKNLGYTMLYNNAVAFFGGTDELTNKSADDNVVTFAQDIVTYQEPVGQAMYDMWVNQASSEWLRVNLYGAPEVSLYSGSNSISGEGPKDFTAKAVSKSQIDLTWSGVSGAFSYNIERGDANATKENGFSPLTQVSGTSFSDYSVTAGVKYKYRVSAGMYRAATGYSRMDSATTFNANNQSLVPATPANFTATAYDYAVDLSWAAVPGATYNIKRSISPTGIYSTVENVSGTSYRCRNLIDGYAYYFKISAVNIYGQSVESGYRSATPQPFATSTPSNIMLDPFYTGLPDFPTGAQYPNGVGIKWDNNIPNALYFEVEYSWNINILNDITPQTTTITRLRDQPGTNCENVTDINNNTNMSIRVRAGNDHGGSSWSPYYNFTTSAGTPPGQPTGLTVTSITQNSITLSWNAVTSNPMPSCYEICNKVDDGTDKFIYPVQVPSNQTSYTFNYLSEGTRYAFTIRSVYIDPTIRENKWHSNSAFTSKVTATTTSSDPCFGVQGGGSGLKGTVFGLTPSYSTGSEYCKAADGNINTFYDYSQATGGYTGLDLGTAKVIGKIRYYPRSTFASRMTGGKFQGSNTSSSSGFVDLYTISGTPAVQWNEVTITNSTAYRWVRYLSPTSGYGNIAEMEFYAPTITQYTITASAGTGGTISPVGSIKVNSGASQTFAITPNSGYVVSAVIVDGVSKGAIISYPFTVVTANHTISATFAAVTQYTITASAGTGGTISPSGSVKVNSGASQTFTITPNSGYAVSAVTVDGANKGAITSYPFTGVTANHTISATFAAVTQYTITASAGANGTISPSGSVLVNSGASQTFTITPNSGYAVSAVTVDGANKGAITSYPFTGVTANHTISATFTASTFPNLTKWYKIATKANTNQCLDVTGGSFTNGTAIELWTKGSVNQEFQFKSAGNGYYTITCRGNTSYSIDMGGNFANNQPLKLWTTDVNNANQKFKLVPITGGYYRIESSNSGFSIDNTGNTGNSVKPYLWTSDSNNANQQWVITVVP